MIGRIYVAGPYTKGDVAVNVRNAYQAANRLADLGFAPFVPHGTHFWHMLFPRPYEFWLDLDNQFLPCCEAVLRLPGESSGADKEVQLARTLGKPVFTDIDSLVKYFEDQANEKNGGS
ncbi:MAG TPA: DUF1937 family protein [Candidatus Angelobacter sp.]|nr:DUF1937 family protein [Candidatus Angelobacter sp.]